MKILQNDPLKIRIEADSDEIKHLRRLLSYKDKSVEHEYKKAKNNKWLYNKDPEGHISYLQELKEKINKNLLFEDDDGYWTYAGLIEYLQKESSGFYNIPFTFQNNIKYPDYELLPWDLKYTPFVLRPYQQDIVQTCLNNPHCAISAATGSGKLACIVNLVKECGLPSLIVTPSTSIAAQTYDECIKAFGKKYVGIYGGGKKEFKRRIVVAIAASLYRLSPESEDFQSLAQKKAIIWDESHRCSSEAISVIMTELAKDIPYRWAFSATQMRGDGGGLFLDSLIGPIKYRKEYRELVDEGYLAQLNFNIISTESASDYNNSNNPKKMAQEHLLYNNNIVRYVAAVANVKASKDEPTLILIDEFEQEAALKPYLKHNYLFASSQSDVNAVVKDFLAGKSNILIGTSAIATGTDIKNIKNLILFIYGSSPIVIRQALGRGTRLVPGKTQCNVFDFLVSNVGVCKHHTENRLVIYREMSDNIKFFES